MIKYFCDRCGKETTTALYCLTDDTQADLCQSCSEKYTKLHLDLVDFLRFSDEEIAFLLSTFRVGDQVITSTGKVGRIDYICTCDRCKERRFYEPHVETEIGIGDIYITDNDKKVDFRSFYKIGDRVFGNIDEDCLDYDIQSKQSQIQELREDLIRLNAQKDVLKKIKENNDGN